MKEEYKTCPNCHNMVDKKDKQCPYCLTSLTRRSMWNSSNKTNTSNTRETRGNNTIADEEYNSDTENYNENSDTIRDDSKKQKDRLWNNWIPTIMQKQIDQLPPIAKKIFNTQLEKKLSWRWYEKNNTQNIDPEIAKKVKKFAIIFFLVMRGLPVLITIITEFFWE